MTMKGMEEITPAIATSVITSRRPSAPMERCGLIRAENTVSSAVCVVMAPEVPGCVRVGCAYKRRMAHAKPKTAAKSSPTAAAKGRAKGHASATGGDARPKGDAPRPKKTAAAPQSRRRIAPVDDATVQAIFNAFHAANPNPKGELEYVNPFTLLVAVVLSAQATDTGVPTSQPHAPCSRPLTRRRRMLALGEGRQGA